MYVKYLGKPINSEILTSDVKYTVNVCQFHFMSLFMIVELSSATAPLTFQPITCPQAPSGCKPPLTQAIFLAAAMEEKIHHK